MENTFGIWSSRCRFLRCPIIETSSEKATYFILASIALHNRLKKKNQTPYGTNIGTALQGMLIIKIHMEFCTRVCGDQRLVSNPVGNILRKIMVTTVQD